MRGKVGQGQADQGPELDLIGRAATGSALIDCQLGEADVDVAQRGAVASGRIDDKVPVGCERRGPPDGVLPLAPAGESTDRV
jgi:hypothetical protein